MKSTFFTLLLTLLTFSLSAQKWEKVAYSTFIKDYTKYLKKQPQAWFTTEITTSLYSNKNQDKPETVQQSQLSVFGEKEYLFVSEGTIQLQMQEVKIDIDTLEKTVLLSKALDVSITTLQPDLFSSVDSTKYEFYTGLKENRRWLKVVEKTPVSSMKTLVFEFDLTKSTLLQLDMFYWPSNYLTGELEDETIEEPWVRVSYSASSRLSNDTKLQTLYKEWLSYDEKSREYSCPNTNYMFYNLLIKQ